MAEPWKVGSRPRIFYFKQTKYGIIAPAVVSALAMIAVVVANAQNETVTVFTKNQSNLLFETVRVGTANAAEALSVIVLQYIPIKPDCFPEQLSQVEDAIIESHLQVDGCSPRTMRSAGLDEGPAQ